MYILPCEFLIIFYIFTFTKNENITTNKNVEEKHLNIQRK